MAGQVSHFVNYAPNFPGDHSYSEKRYKNEYDRLLGVMNLVLEKREFLAGDYSIADMGMPSKKEQIDSERLSNINKFIKEYSANKKEMKLFEEELEELKDMITPGQVGEA